MSTPYTLNDTSGIISPGLLIFRDLLEANLRKMVEIAGSPERLRPHCKTHKMPQVTRIQLEMGITKHKAATFAEAEMLAEAGVPDIFLAYNLVGPNIARAVEFRRKYPTVAFSVTADHPKPIAALGAAFAEAGLTIDVLLDLDTGQHRTGTEISENAAQLYRSIASTPGLNPGGLHLYDGQNHQVSRDERRAAVDACWQPAAKFRDSLVSEGLEVPRIVAGGTGSFPVFAEYDDPTLELSPGTCVFNDVGYSENFPDLVFQPAAVLLTRVVSRPTPRRITLDLGYKACASDPPAGKRVTFPDLPDCEQVLQNEEHLVLESDAAGNYEPGDELIAIPRHICPTSALHRQAFVIENGDLVDRWDVAARDRWITV